MNDPGLPPRPRSLNLLESLVKEEEARDEKRNAPQVVIPTETRESTSPEFYDVDKDQVVKTSTVNKSFSEFKMKDMESSSKVKKGDPHAGFRGKKLRKQRNRSNSSERVNNKSKKATRPFSADYNQNKRNQLSSQGGRKTRPMTTKGRRMNNRTSSPKGQRPRSPDSYSSDTYSSDDEYIKKERFRASSRSPENRNGTKDNDSFFDSDYDHSKKKQSVSSYDSDRSSDRGRNKKNSKSSYDSDRSSERGRNKSEKGRQRSRSSSSSSSSSSSDDESYRGKKKHVNGFTPRKIEKKVKKTVYADENGKQLTKTVPESSDYQRMVVVDDYSSTMSSSEDERQKSPPVKNNSKPPILKPKRKTKALLSRKKQQGYKIFQVDPDLYLEGKLHQKYTELEELMACSFVDQRSHVTRHHLYQMELLRDQYKNASHGKLSAHAIIPQSLPEDIRNRQSRPLSGKRPPRRADSDQDSVNYDAAYGTLRSVMTAERARNTYKIRTDINADRPSSAKHATKKKKKIKASYKKAFSDTEEDTSEKPSFCSKTDSKASSSPRTPRVGPSVDDHIKYSKNDKLKKWLKEKDKIYRQHVKEERRKKREEREKFVNEANEKFENRMKSQKIVKKWMKEKSKEWIKMQKEKRQKEKEEDAWLESYKKTKSVPGDSLRIRPQSAPSERQDDESLREKIHSQREKEEENKQAKIAQEGPHPPQTKFIYKRPVAGKIKLKLQVRGKSPTAQKSENDAKAKKAESEKEKAKLMRLSYDEWVKKKRSDDIVKKENAKRQRELAKSDPELERIIPALGRKRIEDKLNMRKRIDTGIKKFDEKTNRSFGGGEFDGEAIEEIERPRSAYRLESDNRDPSEPALTVKQIQRPSTAPAGRKKVPSPQKSVKSPRKAVIPQRVDKVMDNEDVSNPYSLPFPPNKGIPPHVANRQRKLFAQQISDNLDQIEQRALMNAELIKEGVTEADIAAFAQMSDKEFEQYKAEKMNETKEAENVEDEHPKISELMYSPRKREESSESSSEDNVQVETNDKTENMEIKAKNENDKIEKENTEEASEIQDKDAENKIEEKVEVNVESSENGHSHYKTYDNLNELTLDTKNSNENKPEDNLREDIEILKQRVENLHLHEEATTTTEQYTIYDSQESGTSDNVAENVNITVVTDTESDPNIVGILKESKRENILVPEVSEEPEIKRDNDIEEEGNEPASPTDDLSNSRKRVSFNETTEVFQSFESSSTDTVTPENEEFDIEAASLDAQPDYGDDFEDDDDMPDILKLQGQKMSINIGGFELNPTVIDSGEKNTNANGEKQKDEFGEEKADANGETQKDNTGEENADSNGETKKDDENKRIFITNQETDT